MPKVQNNNLFEIGCGRNRILYRREREGYCVYLCNQMKFYFLDKISGMLFLNHMNALTRNEVEKEINKTLGYSIEPSTFEKVKKQYLEDLPKELLSTF
ncbi:hypothetical protein COY48_02295 [Candidatus Collierbacteria bacterium CG_4_10_14_0_8_um_filter_43_86]|uniref:PqqD family protein n=1 Tax=Candidatus Collierbacteria bacterium CG_4_9_14_3_um_filter_43_16 TaxID=1974532 RepID=A0A2M8BVQ6_9BACT|nr:MAG: hypothetical protein COY48_02295 [Candidatus Collierbacteria bacterium CG_4_10_14_0_8_um_filter_43_86]PJB47921.1 MAG: hypothetical protein CO104_02435 [Candidatus Collierbacteria bacterium CG_4_9_14_3_um_filter_43_16]